MSLSVDLDGLLNGDQLKDICVYFMRLAGRGEDARYLVRPCACFKQPSIS